MGLSYPAPVWNAVWMSALEPRQLTDLFNEPTDIEEIYSEAIDAWVHCAHRNPVDRALQFWTNLYLRDGILAADRALARLERLQTPPVEISAVMEALRRPSRDLAREFESALAEQLTETLRDFFAVGVNGNRFFDCVIRI